MSIRLDVYPAARFQSAEFGSLVGWRLAQPKNADLFMATTLQQLSRSKLCVYNNATYFYIRRPCYDGRSENCNRCNLSLWKYCKSRSLISLRLCRCKTATHTYEK